MKLQILFFCCAFSAYSFAADKASVRDRIADFLQKNVVGRSQTLSTEGTLSSDGATYVVKFEAKISYANLEKTEEGLTFEETRDIKQTNTKLDATGKPTGEPFKTDRTVVHRYSVAERQTVNALVGVTNVVKSTLEDPTGKAFVTMIDLSDDNKQLYIYESMAGFAEASLDGKNVVPVATASDATLFLDANGKLQTNETLKFFKVNVNKEFAREEISRFNLSAAEVK
jgi:hypothetical protein